MEHREKAKEIIQEFLDLHSNIQDVSCAKTCGIKSVEMIIKALKDDFNAKMLFGVIEYWEKVIEQMETFYDR